MTAIRIYLLNPPFLEGYVRCGRWQGVRARGKTLYYPIFLAYATGILEERFDDVRLVDAIAWKWDEEAVLEDILKFNPDMLVLDSNFSSLENDIRFAARVRSSVFDMIKIVVVGPPASVYAEGILSHGAIDVVARKEFDRTLLELTEAMTSKLPLRDILGISYISSGTIIHTPDRPFLSSQELDDIPFATMVYDRHLNVKDYWLDHTLNPMVQIMTSRGCPNLCTFCSWPENLTGREFRARSPRNIADELEWISDHMHDVKEVFFEDDAFTLDKRRVIALAQEINSRGLDVIWSCQSRASVDCETMKAMRKAGCRLLDVGFESGSDAILKNIRKGMSVERSRQFAHDARTADLMILADFVVGFPGETMETIEQTARFIEEIKPDLLQVAIAIPIPGTEFYEWIHRNGFLIEEEPERTINENGFQRCVVSYPSAGHEDLEEASGRILRRYYLNPSYAVTAFRRIWRKNGVEELKTLLPSAMAFLGRVGGNQ